jgi:CMP-N-acetylneuraminic acid synthetase
MKILAIIPARGGSKGVPRKNIKLLGNKPLIAHTFDAAKQSNYLSKIILSSEDEEIIQCANQIGLEAPFVRPLELALDTTPTLPVIQQAVDFYEKQQLFFDAVCILQPTSPFRTTSDIDRAITKFIENDSDSLVSVLPVPHEYNPHWVFIPNEDELLSISTGEQVIISRRQDLPQSYHRDGSIYLVKKNVLLNNSLYGNTISYSVSDKNRYVNIDTQNDWDIAEQIYYNLCVE